MTGKKQAKGGFRLLRGIEEVFGCIKQFGGLCQFKLRGMGNAIAVFSLHVIAYNLIRLRNLLKLLRFRRSQHKMLVVTTV